MFIESINNSIIKQTVSLQNKKYRDELGLFVVEGEKQVLEIPKHYKIEYIILTEKYKNLDFAETKDKEILKMLSMLNETDKDFVIKTIKHLAERG